MIFSKIHSFSKPVPLPPVRKWRTDLPQMRKRAVSRTKTFTNSLFGLWVHWIGSGSKQHKKRRGKSVVLMPSNATGGPRWLPRAERFVRRALLAELAFVDLNRDGFFFSLAGKLWRDGQFNITLPDRDRFTFVSSFAAYLATYRSHHVRRRPERLNCLRPSPFSARLQFVQKVNRLHFLRRLHFLITSDLKIHAIICPAESQLIRSGLNPFRINPKWPVLFLLNCLLF